MWNGSGLNDDFFLQSDYTLAGYSQLITNTPGQPSTRVRFANMASLTVIGYAGTDRLFIDGDGPLSGGSTKFVNYLVNANLGGDVNDSIVLNDSSTVAASYTTVTGNSVGVGSADSLFGAGGKLYYAGIGAGRLFPHHRPGERLHPVRHQPAAEGDTRRRRRGERGRVQRHRRERQHVHRRGRWWW